MQWFRPCSGLIGVVVKVVQWFRPCGGLNCAGGLPCLLAFNFAY